MRRLIIYAVMVLLLVGGVLALADDRVWNTEGRDQFKTRRIPYTGGTNLEFISNCTRAGGTTENTPVVDDLDDDDIPEIVTVHSDVLRVLDRECNILSQTSISNLGNRQPVIFDSENCPNSKSIYLLTNGTVEEWCYDDASGLSIGKNISVVNDVDDGKGLAMNDDYGTRGAFLGWDTSNSRYELSIVDFGTGSQTNLVRPLIDWGGESVLSHGDITSSDSDSDIVLMGNESSNEVWLVDFDNNYQYVSVPMHSNCYTMGVYEKSTKDWFMYYCGSSLTSSNSDFYIYDTFGTQYYHKHFTSYAPYGGDHMNSKTFQLGLGGDVCYAWYTSHGSADSYFVCGNPQTSSWTTYTNPPLNYAKVMADMDSNGYADIIDYGGKIIYYRNNSWELRGVDFPSNGDVWIPLKLDGDSHRDMIFWDGGGIDIYSTALSEADYDLNMEFTNCSTGEVMDSIFVDVVGETYQDYTDVNGRVSFTGVGDASFTVEADGETFYNVYSSAYGVYRELCIGGGGGGCGTMPECTGDCIWYDDYEYTCTLEDMDYNFIPNFPSLTPTAGELCFDAETEGYTEVFHNSGDGSGYGIVTDRFNMTLENNNSWIEHSMIWQTGKMAYTFYFSYTAGSEQLYYIDDNNTLSSLPPNLFEIGQEHQFEIVVFLSNTGGRAFWNESLNRTQAIEPYSITFRVDGDPDKTFYNLPLQNYSVSGNIVDRTKWGFIDGEACIEDEIFWNGEDIEYEPIGEDDCISPTGAQYQYYCYGGEVYLCQNGSWESVYTCNAEGESGECEYGGYAVRTVDDAYEMCELYGDCRLPTCEDRCIAYDDFSYDNAFEDCYWNIWLPDGDTYTPDTQDFMCWNENVDVDWSVFPSHTMDSYTLKVSMILEEDSDFWIKLAHYDQQTEEYVYPYVLNFWESGGNTWIGYWQTINGSPTGVSLCKDCWSVDSLFTAEIWHFVEFTDVPEFPTEYVVENGTNDILMEENTFSLILPHYEVYNLPLYEIPNTDHTIFVDTIGFEFASGGETCISYVKLEERTDLFYQEETPEGLPQSHFRDCWDDGSFDWDCCTSEEQAEANMWCPFRVTILNMLANLTQFMLNNILYFIILAILFVILTPYILKVVRP